MTREELLLLIQVMLAEEIIGDVRLTDNGKIAVSFSNGVRLSVHVEDDDGDERLLDDVLLHN